MASAALPRPSLSDAQREQGASVLERILSPCVLGQRAFEACQGTHEITPRCEQERAATRRDGQRP